MGTSLSLDCTGVGAGRSECARRERRVVYGSGIVAMDSLSLGMGTISQGQRLRSRLASHVARRIKVHAVFLMYAMRAWVCTCDSRMYCLHSGDIGPPVVRHHDLGRLYAVMRLARKATIFRNGKASQALKGNIRGALVRALPQEDRRAIVCWCCLDFCVLDLVRVWETCIRCQSVRVVDGGINGRKIGRL
jgi:hypothetical protein